MFIRYMVDYSDVIVPNSVFMYYSLSWLTSMIVMTARQLCWLPDILFYRCSLDLLSFFRRLISEVAWPIVTKLCHMFDGDPNL